MIVEEADLAGGAIAEHIGVRAGRDVHVGRAGIDPDTVLNGFGAALFIQPIARDAEEREIHMGRAALLVQEGQREIPENAAADALAFGLNGNGFGHLHGARGIHRDGRMEAGDHLIGPGVQGMQQRGKKQRKKGQCRQRPVAEKAAGSAHAGPQNFTCGTARSASLVISK